MFDEIRLIEKRHHEDVVRLIVEHLEHLEHRFVRIGVGVDLRSRSVLKCLICGHIEVG